MIEAFDEFIINHLGHWGHARRFMCWDVFHPLVEGNDDMPALDLGPMVSFWAEFRAPGHPGLHAVPMVWCRPINGEAQPGG